MDIMRQMDYVISQVRSIRVKKGISQMELSLKAGLSQSFLANLEKGKKLPSVLTIIRIARALEVSPKDFFTETAGAGTKQELKDKIIELVNSL